MRKLLVVMLVLALAMMSGCGPKTSVTETGEKVDIVAKVDNQIITLADFDKNYLIVEKSYKELYGEDIMTQAVGDKTVKELIKDQILNNMIMEQLIKKSLVDSGTTISEAQIKENYDKYYDQGLKDNKERQAFYKANGIDEAFIKMQLENQLYISEMRNRITEVTSDSLKANSDQLKATIVKVSARHVLVKDRKQAEELLVKLQAGEDFIALAKAFSIEPGASDSGGDLGFFAKGAMVKPFEDAAFALKPGEISGIVETEFGFHIIKCEAVKTLLDLETDGTAPEELKIQSDNIISAMVDAEFNKQVEAIKAKAAIETYPEAFKK